MLLWVRALHALHELTNGLRKKESRMRGNRNTYSLLDLASYVRQSASGSTFDDRPFGMVMFNPEGEVESEGLDNILQ